MAGVDVRRVSSIPVGYDAEGRPIRVRRRKRDYSPVDTVLYPLADGSGVALLLFLPPFLAVMTLPVIDLFAEISSKNALSPIVLLLLPVALPLIGSFVLVAGFVLLFYGRVLAASAFGEDDHPRWPSWDLHEIAEGLGRWLWACLMGFAIGGFPAVAYWIYCGEVDVMDRIIFVDLLGIGLAYAMMALAAAMLHENLLAANPAAVVVAIRRVGWDYVGPCMLMLFGVGSTAPCVVPAVSTPRSAEVARSRLWGWLGLDVVSRDGDLPRPRADLPQAHTNPPAGSTAHSVGGRRGVMAEGREQREREQRAGGAGGRRDLNGGIRCTQGHDASDVRGGRRGGDEVLRVALPGLRDQGDRALRPRRGGAAEGSIKGRPASAAGGTSSSSPKHAFTHPLLSLRR